MIQKISVNSNRVGDFGILIFIICQSKLVVYLTHGNKIVNIYEYLF